MLPSLVLKYQAALEVVVIENQRGFIFEEAHELMCYGVSRILPGCVVPGEFPKQSDARHSRDRVFQNKQRQFWLINPRLLPSHICCQQETSTTMSVCPQVVLAAAAGKIRPTFVALSC